MRELVVVDPGAVVTRIGQAIVRSLNDASHCAVYVIKIEGVDRYGSLLGYRAAARLRKHVCDRLRRRVRTTDSLGRIREDWFTLVVDDLNKASDAAIVARTLMELVAEPIDVDGNLITLRGHVGCAVSKGWSQTAGDLLATAEKECVRRASEKQRTCTTSSRGQIASGTRQSA